MATRRRSEDKPTAKRTAAPAPAAVRAPRTRASSAADGPAVPARRSRARPARPEADAAHVCAGPAEEAAKAEGFWRAGLRALDNVRNDVQRRQATVIETLLGIPPAAGAEPARLNLPGLPGLDAFGLRKFEDVFDQRVAAALERLGMPTREELQALHDKLDQVLVQLERIGAAVDAAEPGKAAPAAPRARKSR